MKYKDKEYIFRTDKIFDIWGALKSKSPLNDNKKITVKVKENKRKVDKKFPAGNRILCSLVRIEDGLEYLNTYELVPSYEQRNAFGFIDFLNYEYVIVHCIKDLAKIFEVKIDDITGKKDCFSGFEYGNGNDGEVFEYIRSLCAVHPIETSMHPTVHKEGGFDCCERIVWASSGCIDHRDLTAVVYASEDEGEAQYIGIKVESFILYLNKWIGLLENIEQGIYDFVEEEKQRLRGAHILLPEEFESYIDYIDNLKREYELRVVKSDHQSDYFEYYKLAFQIHFDNVETEKMKECYKAAIKYMFEFLHKKMQEMDERKYSGIKDLPDVSNDDLFDKLYLPIEGRSKFLNKGSAFVYVNPLTSSHPSDVDHAREVLDEIKPLVNEYVEFKNTESKDETRLLLQIATYFDALRQDGYINKSIPDTIEYRGAFSGE